MMLPSGVGRVVLPTKLPHESAPYDIGTTSGRDSVCAVTPTVSNGIRFLRSCHNASNVFEQMETQCSHVSIIYINCHT